MEVPVSVQLNGVVKVMGGMSLPFCSGDNSLENLGLLKHMVATQLCNKYPTRTLSSSAVKLLLSPWTLRVCIFTLVK